MLQEHPSNYFDLLSGYILKESLEFVRYGKANLAGVFVLWSIFSALLPYILDVGMPTVHNLVLTS